MAQPSQIIVNGDSAADALEAAGLGAVAGEHERASSARSGPQLWVLRDVLSCGIGFHAPLTRDLRAWSDARESFWRGVWTTAEHWGWVEAPFGDVGRLPANLYAAGEVLEGAEEITVCVGAGLSDQLMLGFLDAWFDVLDLDRSRVRVAAFLESPGSGERPPPAGVPLLTPEDIAEGWRPRTLEAADWRAARTLWQATRARRRVPSPAPLTAEAAWNARFPAASDPLAAWDRVLLTASAGRERTLRDILGSALRAAEAGLDEGLAGGLGGGLDVSLDPVGDLVLLHRIVTLSSAGDAPAWWTLGTPAGFATACSLTEYGAALLESGDLAAADPAAGDWALGLA